MVKRKLNKEYLKSEEHKLFLKQLKKFRNLAGLTQKELGDKIGSCESSYNNFERGRIGISYERLEKILLILNAIKTEVKI